MGVCKWQHADMLNKCQWAVMTSSELRLSVRGSSVQKNLTKPGFQGNSRCDGGHGDDDDMYATSRVSCVCL